MTRKGFGKGLLKAAHKHLVVLTADLKGSTSLSAFSQKYPDQCIDVGVAEQSLAGIAAGLASEGKQVVMTSFAVFNPGRNWDFIRTQIVMNNLPIVIVGSHAGLATGEDGATHQALEDVALMRSLPNITIISPADDLEAESAIEYALKLKTPVYLRLARNNQGLVTETFNGKELHLRKGGDVSIFSTGIMAHTALEAAQILAKEGIHVQVIHAPIIKPFDITLPNNKLLVTLEDHSIIGGLGSALCELASQQGGRRVLRLGTPTFGASAPAEDIFVKYGLHPKGVAKSIMSEMRRYKNMRKNI